MAIVPIIHVIGASIVADTNYVYTINIDSNSDSDSGCVMSALFQGMKGMHLFLMMLRSIPSQPTNRS